LRRRTGACGPAPALAAAGRAAPRSPPSRARLRRAPPRPAAAARLAQLRVEKRAARASRGRRAGVLRSRDRVDAEPAISDARRKRSAIERRRATRRVGRGGEVTLAFSSASGLGAEGVASRRAPRRCHHHDRAAPAAPCAALLQPAAAGLAVGGDARAGARSRSCRRTAASAADDACARAHVPRGLQAPPRVGLVAKEWRERIRARCLRGRLIPCRLRGRRLRCRLVRGGRVRRRAQRSAAAGEENARWLRGAAPLFPEAQLRISFLQWRNGSLQLMGHDDEFLGLGRFVRRHAAEASAAVRRRSRVLRK